MIKLKKFQNKAVFLAENYLKAVKRFHYLLEDDFDKSKQAIMKSFRPKGTGSRTLNTKISNSKIQSFLLPKTQEVVRKYISAKEQLIKNGKPPETAETQEDNEVFDFIENVLKLPSYEKGKEDFLSSVAKFLQSPTAIFPSTFLNAALRSFPANLSNDIESSLLRKGYDSEKDLSKLSVISIFPQLSIKEIRDLFTYYSDNKSEVDSAERNYRSPDVNTSRFRASDSSVAQSSDVDLEDEVSDPAEEEDSDVESASSFIKSDEDFYDQLDKIGAFGEKNIGKGDIESILSAFKKKDQQDPEKISKVFNLLKSKNALDSYFRDMDQLENVAKGTSDSDKLDIASNFLKKVFDDRFLSGVVTKAVAKEAAIRVIEKSLEKDLAVELEKAETEESRKKVVDELKKKYGSKMFASEVARILPLVRSMFPKLFTVTDRAGGKERLAIKDPRHVKLDSELERIIANSIFIKLSPYRIKNLTNKSYSFDDFVGDKVGEVESKIQSTIENAAERAGRRIKKKEVEERQRRSNISPEEMEDIKRKEKERVNKLPKANLFRTKSGKVSAGGTSTSEIEVRDQGEIARGMDSSIAPTNKGPDLNFPQRQMLKKWQDKNPNATDSDIRRFINVIKDLERKGKFTKENLISIVKAIKILENK